MAYVALSSKAIGSTIKLKVNGFAKDFIVVHQGKPSSVYDDSCNGTWLLMKDIYESSQWHITDTNDYANSTIHSYLNGTFLNLFESNIKNAIKQVKLPYRKYSGTSMTVTSGSNGLSAKIFLLSATETSFSFLYMPSGEGAELAYFKGCADNRSDSKRVAYLKGSDAYWWLRSPYCGNSDRALCVSSDGGWDYYSCSDSLGIRPALILPSTLLVSDDGTVSTNTAPSTPGSISVPSSIMGGTNISISWAKSSDAESNLAGYKVSTPGSISVPSSIMGGTNISISWAKSSDAESNLAGYKVERSTNGGSSWSQIYQGTATSTTNNVAFGTTSVMYRVKAYDTEGLESGWRTSSQVTVVNNNAPSAPPSIAVPNDVKGGSTLVISWTAASDSDGNLSGYILERSIDGGSAYTQVYKGDALTYTDTITKSWSTVMYRVKAYDRYDAQSGYTTSTKRTVDNNTAPTITTSSEANLGTKSSGFTISYSVDDEDAEDTLTVTEKLDGTTKRTYTATRKTTNSFAVTGEYFQKITNGSHTMTVTVTDGKATVTKTFTFTKAVTAASITLAQPMEADAQITLCAITVGGLIPVTDGKATVTKTFTFTKAVTAASITLAQPMEADAQITLCAITVGGLIPADAVFKVEVTNNGKDSSPVWEDATTEARNGRNHLFTNQTAANGFAFNFRVTAERGASGESGYIASIQGGFQ